MPAISKSGKFGNTLGYLLSPLWALLLHGLYILRSCLPYVPIMLLQELLVIPSLPADVLCGSFVTHSFECVTNEPQGTSAGRLGYP